MKVAVPAFGSRVSPRFDCAQAILVVTVEVGRVKERECLATSAWASNERINRLVELGVSAVICGGIDRWSAESLQSAGITLYRSEAGEIEDVLTSFLRGELGAERFSLADRDGGHRRSKGLASTPDQTVGTDQGLDQELGCDGV